MSDVLQQAHSPPSEGLNGIQQGEPRSVSAPLSPDNLAAGEPSSEHAGPPETLLHFGSPNIGDSIGEGPRQQQSTSLPSPSISPSPAPGSPARSSPVPGIRRAASLPHATPRPVRRLTDLDQDDRPPSDEIYYIHSPLRSLRLRDDDLYRVSMLSNHAAETFANNIAGLAESVILLPLDILVLRSLSREFLSHHPSDQQMMRASSLLSDVWPLSSGFRVRDLGLSERLQFWGNLIITVGMQGLVNFVIWKGSTQLTLRLGDRFGWGNI